MIPNMFMVFDVESIGLHGEGFAVGYTLIRSDGEQPVGKVSETYVCLPEMAEGDDEGRQWVRENCPPMFTNCQTTHEVRRRFWQDWLEWEKRGAVLVADCAWPVEARFLIACVDDNRDLRTWQGPYPLHELASFMVAAGMDPMATYDHLPDEPAHDPLGDARQSARLLVVALAKLRGESREPVGSTP